MSLVECTHEYNKCSSGFISKRSNATAKSLPSQLAADLGVSHTTVSRWLSGKDVPSTQSCHKLAEYSGVPFEKVLCFAGHLPKMAGKDPPDFPEFRDYARIKYPNELDEDLITMIEDLIERRRHKRYRKSKEDLCSKPPKQARSNQTLG